MVVKVDQKLVCGIINSSAELFQPSIADDEVHRDRSAKGDSNANIMDVTVAIRSFKMYCNRQIRRSDTGSVLRDDAGHLDRGVFSILHSEDLFNAFGMLKKNPVKISNVANIGSSTGVKASCKAWITSFKGTTNIDGKMRKIAIYRDRERLTAINALLEDRNAGVK